jgi:hypothetical protein
LLKFRWVDRRLAAEATGRSPPCFYHKIPSDISLRKNARDLQGFPFSGISPSLFSGPFLKVLWGYFAGLGALTLRGGRTGKPRAATLQVFVPTFCAQNILLRSSCLWRYDSQTDPDSETFG